MKRLFVCAMLVCARASADDVSAARELFQQGMKALEAGKPEDAITSFDSAFRIKAAPSLYFYLGEAHRRAGHAANAEDFYKLYLEKLPQGPKKPEAEAHLVELRAAAAKERASPAPPKHKLMMDALAFDEVKPKTAGPVKAAGADKRGAAPAPHPAATAAAANASEKPLGTKPAAAAAPEKAAAVAPPAAAADKTAAAPAPEPAPLPLALDGPGSIVPDARSRKASAPMEAMPAPPRAAAPREATMAAPRSTRGAWMRPSGVVVGVAGAAALGASAIFGLQAKTAAADVTHAAATHQAFDPDRESAGRRAQTLSLVCVGLGGAAAIAGVLLYAFSPPGQATGADAGR